MARTKRNMRKAEKQMATTGTAINWSEATSYDPIKDAGDYECIFGGGKIKPNKDKTAMKFTAEFTVDDGGEYDGRKAFRDYSLQPNALWALKKMLLACGVDEDEFTDDAVLEELIDQANGARVMVSIERNPDKNNPDKLYTNVGDVRPIEV